MNTIKAFAALLLFAASSAFGQDAIDISGRWEGALEVQGMRLRLVFHIERSDAGYSATVDSPDQGAKGIPVATTTFDHPNLKLEMPSIGAVYEGKVSKGSIDGTWNQGVQSLSLTLSRKIEARKVRPGAAEQRRAQTVTVPRAAPAEDRCPQPGAPAGRSPRR